MLVFRALAAFLALPTVVAGVLPYWIARRDHWRTEGTVWGWPVLLFGAGVLLWCVRDFLVVGRGTLAPWDPPKKLVVVGLYRLVRNPMYIGVLGVNLGWCLLAGSPLLGAYAAALALCFHLRVLYYEEPTLAKQFGDGWARYCSAVSRWLPKLPGESTFDSR